MVRNEAAAGRRPRLRHRRYIKSQLLKPITRALEPVIGREATHELFYGEHTRKRRVILPKTSTGMLAYLLRGDEATEHVQRLKNEAEEKKKRKPEEPVTTIEPSPAAKKSKPKRQAKPPPPGTASLLTFFQPQLKK